MTDTSLRQTPTISRARKAFGYGTLMFGVGCIFVLDQFDIVMNASRSLEEPAYFMFERPVFLTYGAVVSARMPEVLQSRFGDYQFVKRIGGMPGDAITLDADGNPCVNGHCYPAWSRNGVPISPPITPGIIPEGHYALFGTSEDSLDSRYAVIGLIPEHDLLGRGWPMSFMSDYRVAPE